MFNKTIQSFFKTKNRIRDTFSKVLSFSKLSLEEKEQIEECLLAADVGWELTEKIINNLESNSLDAKWENIMISSIKSSVDNLNSQYEKFKKNNYYCWSKWFRKNY
ncbi:signal recognition particle receptor subunit alpha [Candidatus Marinimicrobia bacterium]|nr:signal recognition particle receptor subunit alpha [Candidatus Neomarinimicrobiota bacterium]